MSGGFGFGFSGANVNTQDVKVFRAKKDSWGEKPGGGNRAVYSHTIIGAGIMPRTTERQNGSDGFQSRVTVGKSLFIGDDDDIATNDEVELVDTQGRRSRWLVDGDVDTDYANPLSSWTPGREIPLKKIAGEIRAG